MKNQGFNNFDIVYYINLEHRIDRNNHIINELKKTNIDPLKINRINAIYLKDFGCLGCSKSHIIALEKFVSTPDEIQNCLILEDDFVFTKNQIEVNNLLNVFFDKITDFNVLSLSSNIIYETNTDYSFITRIIESQTTSGYCVSKKFASILLDNYRCSTKLLENIGYKIPNYCIDIYTKQLQLKYNWYCLKPKIGIQMESYSDIEKCMTNYKC